LSKAKEKALAANKCMVEIKTILAGAGIEDYNVNTAWFSANV
jgi:hypothetical protein